MTLTLSAEDANWLRRFLLNDGYVEPGVASRVLDAVQKVVPTPDSIPCYACHQPQYSEDLYFDHLISKHRYPDEDAGSQASRKWRNR